MAITNEVLHEIWGSVLVSPVLDLENSKVRFSVQRPGHEYKLEFTGVSEFSLRTTAGAQWDYTELTGIEVQNRDDRLFIRMDLWSGAATILMTCRDGDVWSDR